MRSECLVYDVTSVLSYSERIVNLEWRHGCHDEHLSQLDLGVYLRRDFCLQVFYRAYPSSIEGKVHLFHMNDELVRRRRLGFYRRTGVNCEEFAQLSVLSSVTRGAYPVSLSRLTR